MQPKRKKSLSTFGNISAVNKVGDTPHIYFSFLVSQKLLKFEFTPAEEIRYGEIFTTNHSCLTYDEYLYKVDTGSPNAFESGDEH